MKGSDDMIGHHHRSTLKKIQKSYKSKHSSKSALKAKNKGKIEKSVSNNKLRHEATKQERRNKAKQAMLHKRVETEQNKKFFDGRKGASRIVAVIPLCPDVDATEVVKRLNGSVDINTKVPYSGVFTVPVERYKQKIQYIVAPRHTTSILDAAQVADFVVFVLSAKQEVDHFGETCLRTIVSQGVSTVYTVVQRLDEVESAKMQTELRKSLLSYISHFFAEQEKVYSIENQQEALNVIRGLCQQFPKGVQWRDSRTYLLAEKAGIDNGSVVVEGIVRGKKLNPDRLVHIPGFGDFQIEKITSVTEDSSSMAVDNDNNSRYEGNFIAIPTADQDDLEEYAPFNDTMTDEIDRYEESAPERGVRLDGHFYLSDDEEDAKAQKSLKEQNKIPKGMSEYQARWILEENSDDEYDSDEEKNHDDSMMLDDDDDEDDDTHSIAPSAYGYSATEADTRSEMFVDLSPEEEARQLKEYREREREDNEFPDEVELPPEVSAKERFARYRGLKNFRSSEWDTDESDPRRPDIWTGLTRFQNFRATRNRVLKEAATDGVSAGTRVLLYIKAPSDVVLAFGSKTVLPVYSLLRYEHKKVVLNLLVTPNTEYEQPIPSKDDLILQCGPRRYRVNPLFSEAGNSSNNVHKMERFLHQGHTSMASVIAPVSFGSTPVNFLKESDKGLELVASGSVADADHNRILSKRIILTGYPYKIHKRLVTIRYMFFNSEDVNWFKAIPLFTKMGRSGYIKESIGTHGYFKCTFNGPLNAQDTIAMSLYKRVWPRQSELWTGNF
ncbi:hypothetical protein V1514DRAFT_334653 [Lipomyces japonicus]|uniref:uncharacterized protein n=1 Tax=Lipomyces japonicus TaxID=56871 RepID=UPI0034CFF540